MPAAAYCTVEYNGARAPEHLRAAFSLREHTFATGKKVEVSAEEAGLLLKSAPAGSVTVHSGTPVDAVARSRRADEQLLRTQRLREVFPKDPARLLSDVAALPKEIRDGLSGKDGIAFVEAGKADGCLFDAAHWAQLSGLSEVAKSAVRRADSLASKR
jgi:hypothetical protein